MERKEYLTNETISKKFPNQFDLVGYAIKLAVQLIKSGRAPRIHPDSDNPAVIIIEEMEAGKDLLDDLVEQPKKAAVVVEVVEAEPVKPAAKQTERKKARRLFA